jgi:hypothetical protein
MSRLLSGEEKAHLGFWERVGRQALILLSAIGVIAAAIATCFAVYLWVLRTIDSTIERKLSSPAVLRKIAAESRPSIIFDTNESIVADLGGSEFIKSISITRKQQGQEMTIAVDFNIYLPTAPLLTPLDGGGVMITSERGKGLRWRYHLQYITVLALAGPSDDPNHSRAFRLELLR